MRPHATWRRSRGEPRGHGANTRPVITDDVSSGGADGSSADRTERSGGPPPAGISAPAAAPRCWRCKPCWPTCWRTRCTSNTPSCSPLGVSIWRTLRTSQRENGRCSCSGYPLTGDWRATREPTPSSSRHPLSTKLSPDGRPDGPPNGCQDGADPYRPGLAGQMAPTADGPTLKPPSPVETDRLPCRSTS